MLSAEVIVSYTRVQTVKAEDSRFALLHLALLRWPMSFVVQISLQSLSVTGVISASVQPGFGKLLDSAGPVKRTLP